LEPRINIKFYVKSEKNARYASAMLSEDYRKETMIKFIYFEWSKRFKEDDGYVEVYERCGRPVSHRIDENVETLQSVVLSDACVIIIRGTTM
jgi:hypothetical protein